MEMIFFNLLESNYISIAFQFEKLSIKTEFVESFFWYLLNFEQTKPLGICDFKRCNPYHRQLTSKNLHS